MARESTRRARALPPAVPVRTAASGVSTMGTPRARRSATKATSSQPRVTTTTNPASDSLSVTDCDSDSSSDDYLSDYGSASKPTASNNRKGGSKRKAKKQVVKPQGDKKQLRYRESYGLAPETPPLSANADDRYTDLPKPSDETLWADLKSAKNDQIPPVVPAVPVIEVQFKSNAGAMGTVNINLADFLTSTGLKIVLDPNNLSPQNLTLPDSVTPTPTDNASATADKHAGELKGFMKLPRELRDRVYRLTLVRKAPVDFEVPKDFGRSAALLRTCKTIHEEATEVLYGQNSFHFARNRQHRGKYYDSSWAEVGYEDVRRFLETIGPVNISKMKYISFVMTDGHGRSFGSQLHVPFPRFVNDPHLHHVLRLIGKHTILERFGFMFAGRGAVGTYDFHLLNAITDIKCYQLDIIRRFRLQNDRMAFRIEQKVRELMVIERSDEDDVDQERKKFLVPMVYTDNDVNPKYL